METAAIAGEGGSVGRGISTGRVAGSREMDRRRAGRNRCALALFANADGVTSRGSPGVVRSMVGTSMTSGAAPMLRVGEGCSGKGSAAPSDVAPTRSKPCSVTDRATPSATVPGARCVRCLSMASLAPNGWSDRIGSDVLSAFTSLNELFRRRKSQVQAMDGKQS